MFEAQKEWICPESFPDLKGYKYIAIDLETKDPDLKVRGSGAIMGNGEIVGIAVAVDGWSGYYPIAHQGGGNLEKDKVMDWIKSVCAADNVKLFHNAMYDVCWLRAAGVHINGHIVDTMVMSSLIDENRLSYTLNSISYEFLGEVKDEKALIEAAQSWGIDPKSEMYKLPAMYVGSYAEKDAELTLELYKVLDKEMKNQRLEKIFKIESDLFPCLIDMKFKGVRVDIEKARILKQQLTKQEQEILLKVKQETGIEPQIWAARSIATVFDKLGLHYERTEKSLAPSFTKNFLQEHKHPIVQMIAKAREINKAHTTFIDTILKFTHKGRIHADINQIRSDQGGTVTGRFSMSNPNLQQIPVRHKELGPLIRSLFIPEENHKWGVFDYSQQEPRILVHYAKLQKLDGIDEIANAYKSGEADFHSAVAKMAGIERSQAKTINLGLMYGMGKNKLMAELGLMKEAAEKLIAQYHAKAPFIKQLMQAVSRRADDSGRIRTLGGRVCHFDLWEPTTFGAGMPKPHVEALKEYGHGIKRAGTYKALNRLIQGSAADMTKLSIIALSENGIIPHIQIHDELDVSVEHSEQAKQIVEIMESAIKLEIPNKVDYECGSNWGDIK